MSLRPPARRPAHRWTALLALACLATTSLTAAHAQTADASLLGTVRDTLGTTIAGATVTALNTATGVTWRVTTSSTGRFAFLQLPLGGPYAVTARAVGYRPATLSGAVLTLGGRVDLDIALVRGAAELPPIAVAGLSDDHRAPSLGANLRIDARHLAMVPAVNRNFTDLAALAPTTGVQSSLLGQRWTSTDIRVDGVQSRNMLRAGEFGAGPFTLSMEAIREFEVSSAVYDVTQGRQGGGSVRAATKAGTNTWSGSAFSYYRGSALAAPTDFQARTRAQREYRAVQWGGSIGGPIVRDRVHLFAALDRWDSNEPLFSGLVQNAADELAAGVAHDSLTRLIQILQSRYALDATHAQIGRLDRAPVANTLFARVDWSLSDAHHLTLSNTFSGWDSPLSGGVDQPITLLDARSNYRTSENRTTAALHSLFAWGLQNELDVGLSTSARHLTPNSTAPRGFVRIRSSLSNGSTGDIKVQFGGNRLAPDDSRESEVQLVDHAYFQRGNVLYTMGTDNALSTMTTYIAEAQSGLFEFNSLADLDAAKATKYSRTLPLLDRQPTTHQHVLDVGAFAQAEWRPNGAVSAMVGVRWDGAAFLTAPSRNPLVEQVLNERTDRRPADWTQLQPRAQVVWNAGGRGRDIVRVGVGRFTAQAPYYVQHNQLLNDGRRIADITLSGAAAPVPAFATYRADPTANPGLPAGATPPPPYVNLVSPTFRVPTIWKGSVSYRRRLTARLSMTATALASRTTNDYMYADRNLRATPAFTLDNEGGRAVFVPASTITAAGATLNANALASSQLGRVLELTNAGAGRQHAWIIEAAAALPSRTTLDASYTYNRATDNTTFGCCLARTATTYTPIPGDPRDLSGSWGASDTDFRHKLVASATTWLPWGIEAGARFVGSTGRPISAVVNGDINGDESTSNDLAFVFDPDDPSTPSAVAASMRRVLDNPDNVARDYLRRNVGRIASRNGAAVPWSQRVDVRFTRLVRIHGAQGAEVGLDVFNVANLLNPRWGAEYQLPVGISNQNPVIQRLPLLNVVGFNQATRQYVYTVNETFGVLPKGGAPYQLQLSIRYRF